MKRINWEVFFDNSSTTEALILFALGLSSFKEFSKSCWPKDCKLYIRALKSRGYKRAIAASKKSLRRRGYLL